MAALRAPLREVAAGIFYAAAAAPVHRLRHVRLGEGVLVYFGVGGAARVSFEERGILGVIGMGWGLGVGYL